MRTTGRPCSLPLTPPIVNSAGTRIPGHRRQRSPGHIIGSAAKRAPTRRQLHQVLGFGGRQH